MYVLDLFAGLGGFSQAFKDRGHHVDTLDNDPQFKCDMPVPIQDFHAPTEDYDVVLASPPCQEFSKSALPRTWASVRKYGCNPSVALLTEAIRVIKLCNPKYSVIENVRGAVKYFKPIIGPPVKHVGSRYLWGDFPIFDTPKAYGKWKLPPSKDRAAIRSLIPYNLSLALCMAIEQDMNVSKFGNNLMEE